MNSKKFIDKFDSGEQFNEHELEMLLFYDNDDIEFVQTEQATKLNRWNVDVVTYLKIEERYFAVPWEKGLTELQDNRFVQQPYEVTFSIRTVTKQETVWEPINNQC